jgi:hypothetical protein
VFTVFQERNWSDSIVSSVKRFKTVGAVNVLVGEPRRGKMADRERSSSPSFAGQRTTAGGLGVPPAQQVRPRACGVMPTLFVILTLNWTWREEAQCTLVFTALIFYMLSYARRFHSALRSLGVSFHLQPQFEY